MTREDKLSKAIEEYIGYACEVDECINTTKRRVAFADGANWQYHQFIEKACEWLEQHANDDKYYSCIGDETLIPYFIKDFKKAMEE